MRKALARMLPLSLLIGGALAAPAPAATVTSGELGWTQFNVYELAAPQGTNRTWLGYVTGGPPLANGAATPSDGATGAPVTTASARGANRGLHVRLPHDHRRQLRRVHRHGHDRARRDADLHLGGARVHDQRRGPAAEARRQRRATVRLGRQVGHSRHLRPQPAGLRPRPLRRDGHAAPGREPHAERDRPLDRHRGLRLPGLRPGRRP